MHEYITFEDFLYYQEAFKYILLDCKTAVLSILNTFTFRLLRI